MRPDLLDLWARSSAWCVGEITGVHPYSKKPLWTNTHVDCILAQRRRELEDAQAAARAAERARGLLEDASAASVDYPRDVLEYVQQATGSIGVRARAGSGKTKLIIDLAKQVIANGETVLVLTLNRDAAAELRRRAKEAGLPKGSFSARTFHSIGAEAWAEEFEFHLVNGDEDDEEAAAAAADGKDVEEAPTQHNFMPNKNKMILKKLYPWTPEEGNRAVSLEVALAANSSRSSSRSRRMAASGCPAAPRTR